MSGQFVVRAAAPDGWQQWRELRLAALADTPLAFASSLEVEQSRPEADWRGWLKRADGARYIAYDADGLPVGIAAVYLKVVDLGSASPGRPNPAGSDVVPELISMWVAPTARGRGAGRVLVEAVSDWVAGRGSPSCT